MMIAIVPVPSALVGFLRVPGHVEMYVGTRICFFELLRAEFSRHFALLPRPFENDRK